jgi:hypothetical protein
MRNILSATKRAFYSSGCIQTKRRPPSPSLRRGSSSGCITRALADGRLALLNGLFEYWRAAVDLVQRQEHGGQKALGHHA